MLCSARDNSRIVSCGADKLVILTDVSTGNIIRKYRGHLEVRSSFLCLVDPFYDCFI